MGKKDFKSMLYIAENANKLDENDLANAIVREYLDNHFLSFNENDLYIKHNIEFFYSFYKILTSKDKWFDLFYQKGDIIDSIININGLSKSVIDYIITKEEVTPILDRCYKNGIKPDWKKIYKCINYKYFSDYPYRNVLHAKVEYYNKTKNWKKYLKYAIQKIDGSLKDTSNILTLININSTAWMIFLHSTQKNQINKAIKWMERLNMETFKQHGWMDTYANLLYKVNRKNEAILWESKALAIATEQKMQIIVAEYKENLIKMQKGRSTLILE
jgi:hypothetical protein